MRKYVYQLLNSNYKKNTKSFIKTFRDNTETELITLCLNNN